MPGRMPNSGDRAVSMTVGVLPGWSYGSVGDRHETEHTGTALDRGEGSENW